MLARDLAAFDVVNVGAAGTFVVRKPVSRSKLLDEMHKKLPTAPAVAVCDARDLIRLERENPFGAETPNQDVVRFVSILCKAPRQEAFLPVEFPRGGEWVVRVIGFRRRLVFGVYRRHMKTIRYLGEIDKLFGVPATTRSWSTMLAVLRIVKNCERAPHEATGKPAKKPIT